MLRFSRRLCSSPMSAWIRPNTATSLPWAAGMGTPLWAIRVRSPMVFKAAVFPPAFAPEMMRVDCPGASCRSTGTALGSSRGWRASRKNQYPSELREGMVARKARAHFAFARTRSKWPSSSTACWSFADLSRTRVVRSRRILRSSSFSSWRRRFSSLFSSSVERGSMKKVARDWDWSWMIPGRAFLFSALTATT